MNHDPKIVDLDPDIIDHESRLREQPHDVIDLKGGGMLTKENGKGKHGSLIYYHESGEIYADDVDQHMAVLLEVASSTAEINLDDIQVGGPGTSLAVNQEK